MKKRFLAIALSVIALGAHSSDRDEYILSEQQDFSVQKTTLDPIYSDYPSHYGKSPKAFDKIGTPSDTFIVSDRGPDNDAYRFRDDSKEFELQFELRINRFVGDKEKLIQNGLMSSKFKLYIPTYDIDPTGSSADCDGDEIEDSLNPEVDEVYFNGEKIGELSGGNNLWNITANTFELDISKLNLPTEMGETAINKVQIKIDTANKDVVLSSGVIGCKQWATEIDYVALDFDVVDPVLLVTGLFGKEDSYIESGYTNRMEELGIPYKVIEHSAADYFSCLTSATESYAKHGKEIRDKSVEFANQIHASKFNVIAHSKAGLDSRYFIRDISVHLNMIDTGLMDGNIVRNPIEVNSLVAHGTPYKGTILADAVKVSYFPVIGSKYDSLVAAIVGDICDLTIEKSTKFTADTPIPPDIKYLSIKGDADGNRDGYIDNNEVLYNQVGIDLANKFYKLIRDGKSLEGKFEKEWVVTPIGLIHMEVLKFYPVATDEPQYNDTMVSLESATPYDVDKAVEVIGNHKTILFEKNDDNEVWTGGQDIVIDEALNGMLQWSVEQ